MQLAQPSLGSIVGVSSESSRGPTGIDASQHDILDAVQRIGHQE